MQLSKALSIILVAILAIAAVAATRRALDSEPTSPSLSPDSAPPPHDDVPGEDAPGNGFSADAFPADTAHVEVDVAAEPLLLQDSEEVVAIASRPCRCEATAAELMVLLAEQRAAMAQLQETSLQLAELFERALADLERAEPPHDWHARMIEQNRSPYQAIHDFLVSLQETEFPTERTWYGSKWKQLTLPFRVGRFPMEAERDQLVMLLDQIGDPLTAKMLEPLSQLKYAD